MNTCGEPSSSSAASRTSFTYQTWQRLRNICHALRQTEDKVRNLKAEAECKLKSTQQLREKRAELQACRMSIESLETQLEWRRANTRTAAARLTKTRFRAADNNVRMNHFRAEIEQLRAEIADKQRRYIGLREKLIWSAAQLVMRRRQMIRELREIFFTEPVTPLTPLPNGKNTSVGIVCNCKAPMKFVNVHLPDAEDYYGHNDVELSVGLYYVAQALVAVSQIFDTPLRYRFEFFGSRSSVCDFINPDLQPNQRTFPLFSRNQDKLAFQYGVFLLNKNIAQMRCDCGTVTEDLRCTLANISSLINHLCDAKVEPYLYITRAVRLGTEDYASVSSVSRRRQSQSVSSGAQSSDSGGERGGFRLEIPPSRLSAAAVANGGGGSGGRECEFSVSVIEKSSHHHQSSDDKINKPYAAATRPKYSVIPTALSNDEDYEDGWTTGDCDRCYQDGGVNGSVAAAGGGSSSRVIDDKDILRTCYLTTSDDEEQQQQHCSEHNHANIKSMGGCAEIGNSDAPG